MYDELYPNDELPEGAPHDIDILNLWDAKQFIHYFVLVIGKQLTEKNSQWCVNRINAMLRLKGLSEASMKFKILHYILNIGIQNWNSIYNHINNSTHVRYCLVNAVLELRQHLTHILLLHSWYRLLIVSRKLVNRFFNQGEKMARESNIKIQVLDNQDISYRLFSE